MEQDTGSCSRGSTFVFPLNDPEICGKLQGRHGEPGRLGLGARVQLVSGNREQLDPSPGARPARRPAPTPVRHSTPETIPGAWTPRPPQRSLSQSHGHCSREPGQNSPIRGTGLRNLKDDTTHVRAHRVGHLSRRLARAVHTELRHVHGVAEVKQVWQQRPWARSAKGWRTVLPVPTAPGASTACLSLSFPFCTTRQPDGPFPNGNPSSSYGLVDCCQPVTDSREEARGGMWPATGR